MNRDFAPILFGVLISTALAGTLVIAGLKAGITPGVSPLVILIAWGAFLKRATGPGGARFLNMAQVAGSAGMAVTTGIIFAAPLVQILYAVKGLPVPPVDIVTLMILSLSGALMGFGFVGLATKKFLGDPTFPAPEARAAQAMIDAAVAKKGERPALGRSLYLGLFAGLLAPLLANLGLAGASINLAQRSTPDGNRSATLGLPFSPIYLGIGGLLTLSTALLIFSGSFLRLVGDWILAGMAEGTALAAQYPANSMRWVGGGAMTVAVAYSLIRFMRMKVLPAGGGGRDRDPRLIEVDPAQKRWQLVWVVLGAAIMLTWLVAAGKSFTFIAVMGITVLIMAMLMVTLGAILSLQIGSSASPVSGTVFVTTLVLCVAALATHHGRIEDVLVITPLLVAACVAVCTANDSSQDYKTLQLCGVRVQDGFLSQLLGLMGGVIVVPLVLYVAHEAYVLGSPALPAPQGQMFATLVDGLLLQSRLPWFPITIGLLVGALAVALDWFADRKGHQLPSMALAVGIYLPAAIGTGILIGAAFRRIGEAGLPAQRNESILAAAGLITGAAALDLILGILIISVKDFTPESLRVFGGSGIAIPGSLPNVICALGILGLGLILWHNARGPGDRSPR